MPGFEDFIGQTAVKDLIRPKIKVARTTGTTLPHLLICGGKEHGKTTFAAAIAAEMGAQFSLVSGATLVSHLDLTGLASNLKNGQLFAVADVESVAPPVLEDLVEAISAFRITIRVGVGPSAKVHSLPLPKFTFVCTSSKPWLVDERLRRWCIPCQFASYSQEEAGEIVRAIARKKGLQIDADAASEIASQCKRRPGDVEVFLQKVANHFSFVPSDRIGRSTLIALSDFLGSGSPHPDEQALTDQLRQMDGIEFEHWVADLFRRGGFQVETTQASGDHGVDLWVSIESRLTAVQCKRWDSPVGEPVVRDLYGAMVAEGAKSGCLVTTGSFTAQAHRFAEGKPLYLMGWEFLMAAVRSPEALGQALLGLEGNRS